MVQRSITQNWFASDSLLARGLPLDTPTMIHFIISGQVDTTGLFREELTFKNPPPLNLEYWKFFTEHGWAIIGLNPPNAYADEDTLALGEVPEKAFDFSYNQSSRSATAADGGLPLGASRWIPFIPASANDVRLANSVNIFPNPAENQVTFNFVSREVSRIKIQIFDVLGRELHSVNGTVNQGNNDFVVSLDKLSYSGVFLYQMQLETMNGTRSIFSGKIIKK